MSRLYSRRKFSKRVSNVATATILSCELAEEVIGEVDFDDETFRIGLKAWLNTLLPKDEHSLGAGDLGVHLEIEAKAKLIHNYGELLRRGMNWADDQAKAAGELSFEKLTEFERVKIVTVAEARKKVLHSVPGQFFFHTLQDGILFYYGKEESWAGIGFPHAPQPIGFPDYEASPAN